MLQIKEVRKTYVTGDLTQVALDNVSLNLRDNEFVAILGPSGSGKTTLLNVIGGLDRYESGDLIINGISTKKYKDRDWDSYRNHTIGFVFQSYNLIPHQTVLANVELALTISGISGEERRKRATEALEKVGLGQQLHKKPNQMSGGQMQRVALARALVNDPDILLADEPTGALDTDTSIQVMDLLKEVAKDRLVVMVTHNPELAEQYATRIVRLRDGKITDDSDPYEINEDELAPPENKNMGRSSMSFITALGLSFNNLKTKKGRTLMTSFAGSIGIIGIALILSLSNGVKNYIDHLQRDTMNSYPITIESQSMDLGNLFKIGQETVNTNLSSADHETDAIYANVSDMKATTESLSFGVTHNNLSAFKDYLDDPKSEIQKYIGQNGVVYNYDTHFDVYTRGEDGSLLNTDGGSLSKGISFTAGASFGEMLTGKDGEMIGNAVTENYDLLCGAWPKSYDEIVLVLDAKSEIPSAALASAGILPRSEYAEILQTVHSGNTADISKLRWNYEDVLNKEYFLIPTAEKYIQGEDGLFAEVTDDDEIMEELMAGAQKLKVVGVIRQAEDAVYTGLTDTFGYTRALTDYVIERSNNAPVVLAQKADKKIDVLTGEKFGSGIFNTFDSASSYDENMTEFGYVEPGTPSSISIYTDSFDDKEAVTKCIEKYNDSAKSLDRIHYTDYVQMITSSVSVIVGIISGILIAFVAVSLVVSSIMIGIITYISVLERTKEIGILRAIGASKRNVAQVFKAETFIIGFFSGVIGIVITLLILIPVNGLVHALSKSTDLNAMLPLGSGLILLALSTGLTVLGGIIPAKSASKKDPVTALRSE